MAQNGTPSTAATILVVDDDPGIRELLCRGLAPLKPASILEAADGIEAQQLLVEQPVDVVLTDMLMPRMDGRELMRWAHDHCPGPLWIVLSGLDTFDAAVDALQLGAFDFISKPLTLQHVRLSVRNALEKLHLARERERLYHDLELTNELLARKVDDLRHVCRMLEDQSEIIQADLARAEVIQRALLPQVPPRFEGWCVDTLYRPGSNVGGDFYDFVPVDGDHLGLVIADAAGHGVAAAMLSVLFKHRLRLRDDSTGTPLEPAEVLRRLNRSLYADLAAPGAFITAAYLLLDLKSGHLRMASAGHPPCFRFHGSGECQALHRTGPALGLEADARYGEATADIAAGDRLLVYTDGVLEGTHGAPTQADLIQVMGRQGEDRRALLEEIFERASRATLGDPDDVTMILLERAAGVSRIDDTPGERQPAHVKPDVEVLRGDNGNDAYISIRGRATWVRSQAFLDAAVEALGHTDHLIVDLGDCEHLDSTFLGTLHEVVTRQSGVDVQRVPAKVHGLFEELAMQAVIDRITPAARPLPAAMEPAISGSEQAALQGERILKAHEMLASLSEENRQQFAEVIEGLRSELARP